LGLLYPKSVSVVVVVVAIHHTHLKLTQILEISRSDLVAVLFVPQEGQESDQLQNPRPDPNSPDPNRASKKVRKNDEKSPGAASKQHDLLKIVKTNLY